MKRDVFFKRIQRKLFIFIISTVLIAVSRHFSPSTWIDGEPNYLSWLPLSVIISVLLLWGRTAAIPLTIATVAVYLWLFSAESPWLTLLFIGCVLVPVIAVCGALRRWAGRRWRYDIMGRNGTILICALGFAAPCLIKALMYLTGMFVSFSDELSPYFGMTSYLFNVIDVQSLIISALVFSPPIYYSLRILLSPAFRRAMWLVRIKPYFSPASRTKTVVWLSALFFLMWMFCSPVSSELFSAYMLPLLFFIFTVGIRSPGATFIAILWAISAFALIQCNKNFVHSINYGPVLAFTLSIFIAFTVCLYYMIRIYNRGARLQRVWHNHALTDPMTWLPNLRALDAHMKTHPGGILCCIRLNNLEFLGRHYGFLMRAHCKSLLDQTLSVHLRPNERVFQFIGCEVLLYLHEGNHEKRLRQMVSILNARRVPWKEQQLTIEHMAAWGRIMPGPGELNRLLGQLSYLAEQTNALEPVIGLDTQPESVMSARSGQVELFQKIKQALDNGQLLLVGQPIVGRSGERYDEILSRLMVDGRIMMPDTFLPIITQCDLSVHFDMLVMAKLLNYLSSPVVRGEKRRFSVNLMPVTLMQNGAAQRIVRLFTESQVDASRIVIEVTEEQAFSTAEHTARNIQLLRQAGFMIAIDDFGTGYSNYERLKRLDADIIKIDGCFIRNITSSTEDVIIVQSICALAKYRGLDVVAEFVETAAQRELLFNLGVDYLQGYLVGKPELLA
ncbi:diguanylate cyclase/phosphodiesterase [Mangrovibacter plantisponsor]|uniref:Diguanylate cyclase/phosphodiesterase n=1 Tax=Mangrovibacter plantisponsor TaxID=451513 RepID=A0A317Q0W1_9ENTR|nr:diguanylate cyclase/phosphodiesterase [Mangrovibacter plantisponsor]